VCNVWAGVVKFIVAILSPRHVMYFQAIVEPLLRRSDLMVFKMAAIADFKKFKFITTGGVKRSNMRHHAKFYADRFNCWCDMAIFDFFKWPSSAILDSLCLFGPPTKSIWWSLSLCKVYWNRCGFDNMHVLTFCKLRLKMPIYVLCP